MTIAEAVVTIITTVTAGMAAAGMTTAGQVGVETTGHQAVLLGVGSTTLAAANTVVEVAAAGMVAAALGRTGLAATGQGATGLVLMIGGSLHIVIR